MYHVNAHGIDECVINVHYYYDDKYIIIINTTCHSLSAIDRYQIG